MNNFSFRRHTWKVMAQTRKHFHFTMNREAQTSTATKAVPLHRRSFFISFFWRSRGKRVFSFSFQRTRIYWVIDAFFVAFFQQLDHVLQIGLFIASFETFPSNNLMSRARSFSLSRLISPSIDYTGTEPTGLMTFVCFLMAFNAPLRSTMRCW